MSYRFWTNENSHYYAFILRKCDPRAPDLKMNNLQVMELTKMNAEIIEILIEWGADLQKCCDSVKLLPITRSRFEREAARSQEMS